MGVLHTYALAPSTLKRYLRRSQGRLMVVVTLSFTAFGAYLLLNPHPVVLRSIIPLVVFTALAYILVLFFNYRQQIRLLYSVRVDLDTVSIACRQSGQEPRRVMRAAIARVLARKDGYQIKTSDPRFQLFIPYGLTRDGDEAVREALQSWAGIIQQPACRPVEPLVSIFAAAVALLVLVFANSLWLVAPLGLFIFAWGFYQERRLMRSSRVGPGTLRMVNSAFAFLLFVIVMKSCILTLILATGG